MYLTLSNYIEETKTFKHSQNVIKFNHVKRVKE